MSRYPNLRVAILLNGTLLVVRSTWSSKTDILDCSEVCQITLRSQQKLEDHVKYSPLHGSMLSKFQASSIGSVPADWTLLHEGLQLFWRLGETLQVNIYSSNTAGAVNVIVLDPEDNEKVECASFVLREKEDWSVVPHSMKVFQSWQIWAKCRNRFDICRSIRQ